ncbi:MAG: TIGR03936 family radical SAM-associated protein [Dehalococcoidia bacterium]|nr:TIGR03936 family radical SAM-associated protein [Dehalococcoidia bacterium]
MQQRLRLTFSKGERVRFISHLDTLRYWERVVRRAGLPLAYSKGFTPHPRLTFAGPLPMGFLAERELMDMLLDERVEIEEARQAMVAQTAPALPVVALDEVPLSVPALQSALSFADYRAVVPEITPEVARTAVADFLALESLEWTEQRKDRERVYDLRAGVVSFSSAAHCETGVLLRMRLAANQDFTVRPEQVLEAALPGAVASHFVRERLYLEEHSPARELWRRKGQYTDERVRR